MGISPLLCAAIWVKGNWLLIYILDICRIVTCTRVAVGELCVLLGPLKHELRSIFFAEFQDQFNSSLNLTCSKRSTVYIIQSQSCNLCMVS